MSTRSRPRWMLVLSLLLPASALAWTSFQETQSTSDPTIIPIAGVQNATTGLTFGVAGLAYSAGGSGLGVWNYATTGANAHGIFGLTDSTVITEVAGLATATGRR